MEKVLIVRKNDSDKKFSNFLLEKITYIIPISGCFIDQLSTRIGLAHSNIYEMNPKTAHFIKLGIWLYVDLAFVMIILLVSRFIIKYWSFKNRRVILLLPITFGILKMVTGMCNVYLIVTNILTCAL